MHDYPSFQFLVREISGPWRAFRHFFSAAFPYFHLYNAGLSVSSRCYFRGSTFFGQLFGHCSPSPTSLPSLLWDPFDAPSSFPLPPVPSMIYCSFGSDGPPSFCYSELRKALIPLPFDCQFHYGPSLTRSSVKPCIRFTLLG